MDVLSQTDLDRASLWVDQNVDNGDIQTILNEVLEQSRHRVLQTQISLGDSDCAFVVRPWGNEIYVSDSEEAECSRLKIAVAVRAVAAKEEEPGLWDYLHNFGQSSVPTRPRFEIISGGKA